MAEEKIVKNGRTLIIDTQIRSEYPLLKLLINACEATIKNIYFTLPAVRRLRKLTVILKSILAEEKLGIKSATSKVTMTVKELGLAKGYVKPELIASKGKNMLVISLDHALMEVVANELKIAGKIPEIKKSTTQELKGHVEKFARSLDLAKLLPLVQRDIANTFLHECMHLIHAKINEYVKLRIKADNKVLPVIAAKLGEKLIGKGKPPEYAAILAALRAGLFILINNVLMEGIATFATRYISRNGIAKEDLVEIYEEGKRASMLLLQSITNLMKVKQTGENLEATFKNFSNILQFCAYPIGLCVCYTIMYVNTNLELGDLFKLKHFEAIALYESSSQKLGLQPVISYHGEGIFDYNRVLKEIWHA